MQIFRQREFVRLGTAEQALAHRDYWLETGREMLNCVGLDVQPVVANDPFFGRGGTHDGGHAEGAGPEVRVGHRRWRLGRKANRHHFLQLPPRPFRPRLRYWLEDGSAAHTACIGFGLERIALALFMTHGCDPDGWPSDVKNVLEL